MYFRALLVLCEHVFTKCVRNPVVFRRAITFYCRQVQLLQIRANDMYNLDSMCMAPMFL